MVFVTAGLMNKQIAAEMDVAEITVKFARGHLMRKMAAPCQSCRRKGYRRARSGRKISNLIDAGLDHLKVVVQRHRGNRGRIPV
jgi:hypothetical protein